MTEPDLSSAIITLMKGVVYRDTHERAWKHLLQLQPRVRDYVEVLGLQVVIDEAEGYAFIRQRPSGDGEAEAEAEPAPRLIPRRPLSFHVSLLLALLRKKLADGRNTLVTGDIGSGKSTIVDAITTLLLPAHRISYNKAAGAETRERSLRSYVLGYYKSERNEVTGSTRPIALRDATKFSVIVGVFTNDGYAATVTVGQVFWLKNGDVGGQPDRFFVTADTPLSIAGDFLEFGGDMNRLRRRLKATDGVRLHDGFPEYGKDFRRRLGIESEQAMELFHQTVSMKSVGNLTDFVREHMLEPFNAAQATKDIVAHFEDLTKAHEAVQRAQAQLAALTPLLADCDTHDRLAGEIAALSAQREALRYYFADHKARLLDGLLTQLDSERVRLTAARKRLD